MSETAPSLPPLFSGLEAGAPFGEAVAQARRGIDPGLVTYRLDDTRLSAALVLAPEAPLQDAAAMLLVAGNGFADAFGALSPSEVACQFDWPGGIRINGARAGRLIAAAATHDPAAEPDWLVIGLEVAMRGDTSSAERARRRMKPRYGTKDAATSRPRGFWKAGRVTRWSGFTNGLMQGLRAFTATGPAAPGVWARKSPWHAGAKP